MPTLHADPEKQRQIRIKIENLTIALLAAFSLFLFILTFFPFSRISQTMQISFEMGRMVQRAFSIILLPSASNYGKGNAMHGRLPWVFLY